MIKSLESKFKTFEEKTKTNERLETMKEVKKLESLKQMSGYIKQVNDKVEILESKTEVTNRELGRKLNNLALLHWNNFVWDLELFQINLAKILEQKLYKIW